MTADISRVCLNLKVQYFKNLGGLSASDMTRRILRKVMTDDIAAQMNWKGHNGKLAFESLKISDVIAGNLNCCNHT